MHSIITPRRLKAGSEIPEKLVITAKLVEVKGLFSQLFSITISMSAI